MIELRRLTKSYVADGQRRYVFRDLSFAFPDGRNIGLLGRNGAGKSTLMRLLGGIDSPDSGEVVSDKTISWPVGLQGGFQGALSGRDNVKFVCRIFGDTDAEMKDRARFVEGFAEIGEYFDQPVKTYSSGMRARVAFGLSMAFDFDYYLIDEVMAVGDAQFRRKSKVVLRDRLKSANIILVTHNMAEVAKLCDVIALVEQGGVTVYTDVREGIEAYESTGTGPGPRGRGALRGNRPGAQRRRRKVAAGKPPGVGAPADGAPQGRAGQGGSGTPPRHALNRPGPAHG